MNYILLIVTAHNPEACVLDSQSNDRVTQISLAHVAPSRVQCKFKWKHTSVSFVFWFWSSLCLWSVIGLLSWCVLIVSDQFVCLNPCVSLLFKDFWLYSKWYFFLLFWFQILLISRIFISACAWNMNAVCPSSDLCSNVWTVLIKSW